jgi:4-diphosphocytidyl-2-C-methyl-D-erythritol kinase
LAYVAAEKLLDKFNLKRNIIIDIEKHIPQGGGLGGGSSNAASVIVSLNQLLNLNLTKAQMMEIAAEIGSDVPFFIEGGTAAGVSRGEIIVPMKPLPILEFLAVFPDTSFSTAEMYKLANNVENICNTDYFVQIADLYENPVKYFENDFDSVVDKMSKRVAITMEQIRMEGYKVMLSGSGSTFLVFKEKNINFDDAINLLPLHYTYKLVNTNV